ncbi:uncharacterized protein [Macrobrachium rosenbergii]|uniref:uncharacterized protein isoform X2 n=1 Tax=Macrobrachium rosenbergii TaxID=79674 RepID=UPI0034D49A44
MTFSLRMLPLMVIGSVVTAPDNTSEFSSDFSSSLPAHPQDGNLMDSDEHLTWELVGEFVQDFDNITAVEDPEEVLQDAGDPPMLSEDLCPALLMKLEKNPKALDDLKLDHPLNLTRVVKYSSCFRSRWNVKTVCPEAHVRYRSYIFCCQPSQNTPILSKSESFIKCKCPVYEDE